MNKTEADLWFFDYLHLRILSLDEKSKEPLQVLLEMYTKMRDTIV